MSASSPPPVLPFNPELLGWAGARTVYRRMGNLTRWLAVNGHVTRPRFDARGRVLAPGSVSEELRAMLDAMGRGDETELKGLLHLHGHRVPWEQLDAGA